MITVGMIYDVFNTKAPFETAEVWDNSGLLVGDSKQEVSSVLVALDITGDVIDQAVRQGAQLIISHHPVIFDGLKAVTPEQLVYRLIQQGLSALCVHTNADKAADGVNDRLAALLGLENVRVAADGFSRVGTLPQAVDGGTFAKQTAQVLHTAVRVHEGTDLVHTVVVCGGAGGDLVLPLLKEADAALTGELKHHEWLNLDKGKTVVDGGHYATEIAVVEGFAAWLREAFPDLQVLCATTQAPYQTIKD